MTHRLVAPTLVAAVVLLGPAALAAPAAAAGPPPFAAASHSHGTPGSTQHGDSQGGRAHGHGDGDGHGGPHAGGPGGTHQGDNGQGPDGSDHGDHGTQHGHHGGPGPNHGDHGSHGRSPAPATHPVPHSAPVVARPAVRDLVLVRPAARPVGSVVALATAPLPRTVSPTRSTGVDRVVGPAHATGLTGAAIGTVAQPLAPVWQQPSSSAVPYVLGMLGVLLAGLGLWSAHLRGLGPRRQRV
jgi:hypothetical protein